jgi:hypothetical protein
MLPYPHFLWNNWWHFSRFAPTLVGASCRLDPFFLVIFLNETSIYPLFLTALCATKCFETNSPLRLKTWSFVCYDRQSTPSKVCLTKQTLPINRHYNRLVWYALSFLTMVYSSVFATMNNTSLLIKCSMAFSSRRNS